MIDYFKKHKFLTIAAAALICLALVFVFFTNRLKISEMLNETTEPEPLSNFIGYWKSGDTYFRIIDNKEVQMVIDNYEDANISKGKYTDNNKGGKIHFYNGNNYNCICYKTDNNGLNLYLYAESDDNNELLTLTRIDENTFNEAEDKTWSILVDKGIVMESDSE